jgi:hypothetical protein
MVRALPDPVAVWLDLRADAPPAVQASRSAPTRTGALAGFDPQRPDAYHMTGGSLAQWFDVIVHRQAVAPGARCSRDTARRPGTEWCRAAHDVGTSPCAATAPVIAGRPTAGGCGHRVDRVTVRTLIDEWSNTCTATPTPLPPGGPSPCWS